ncbi:MSC_0882 family membrane protein [Mycoplasma todarodis]|uniref:MSC_0882 family membrane protein n=1 Tax=Mycoplasma todarodis TaxID=1937191 RepID=UPI003B318474
MDLRPINNNDTITFVNTSTFTKTNLKTTKIVADPTGAIPNGIYGVIRWEKFRQVITMILSGALLIAMAIIITLGATKWDFGPLTYVAPSVAGILALFRFSISTMEFISLKKSVARYRQDIQVGLTSTPPFISKMYIGMHKKQVAHNWITFSLLFYGGLSTIILWWLKDVSWWIFKFDVWIHNWMGKPSLIATLMSIALLVIAIVHIIFAIQRKKRINDMNMYFGAELAPESQVEEIKAIRNKAYRRLFIISVIVVLVIPMVVLAILKLIRRKR